MNFVRSGFLTAVYALPIGVAGPLQRLERLVDPAALGRPARDVLLKAAGALQHVAADRRVERQLHLIDGDAVGRELDRLLDAALPVLFGLAEHAGDEIDVDLRKPERLRELVGAEDLGRPVRAAVQLEDVIVEVLDAEAEPRHAQVANRRELASR